LSTAYRDEKKLSKRAAIAKSISSAFVTALQDPAQNTAAKPVAQISSGSAENVQLRGIPSEKILEKADDIFISLESCKNCLFHLKSSDPNSPILKKLTSELSTLAKESFDEIKDNREHDNPRFCLNHPVSKYYTKEENTVFRILWFFRDLWHHLFNSAVQMTSYEAMNFLLDQRYLVSKFIPTFFRFVNKYLRPQFDVWLGRSFLNLIPHFSGEFLQQTKTVKEKIVYIRTSENEQDDYIALSVPEHIDFHDFTLLISKETNIRIFKLAGMHNNLPIRMQKMTDVHDGTIVIVKQTDAALENRINSIMKSWNEENKAQQSKADAIFQFVQTELSPHAQKVCSELVSLYFTDQFHFIFKVLKMGQDDRSIWTSHMGKIEHEVIELMKRVFQQAPIQANTTSPVSSPQHSNNIK
jgi:hypothetical protein